ncbi:MAG: hypothetical protein WC742_11535 [Gallionellaceae bacterium]
MLAEIIYFQPRAELSARQNLSDFISHCRNKLTLYEEQGGFTSNKWIFVEGNRSYAMAFSKYSEVNNPYQFEPLDEPFLTFAKARVRYTQSERQVKSIGNQMIILRQVHDALIEVHGKADVLQTDGLVMDKVRELTDLRYSESDLRYRLGQQMELLYEFLRKKAIVPTLPEWSNPWGRARSKAERTDSESRKWQEERCPSLHQMTAIADCFSRAVTKEDQYWSSVLTLLMFAPSRAGELPGLVVDCLHETENGRLGVRWYGEKGFGDTIKWVPDVMRETVIEAHRRLVEIGAPARAAAKFAYDNPDVFYRHEECITPLGFPADRPLSAQEFAHAMNFGQATLHALKDINNEATAWHLLGLGKWIKKLRSHGNPTYQQLAQYTQNEYEHKEWPLILNSDRPVWESLLLIRDREFHNDFKPRGFSWLTPSVNQINWQLAPRDGLKNPTKTLFQRFGIVDEDGSEIRLTSHQLRVWLSTNAERGGMDSWQLSKWAGRARIQDNRHYDLRTPEEREDQVRAVMLLTERPTALEAIKLNLPVSYQDLGLIRIGIADMTEYGMCTHDYAMSPCTKGGECMTCKEHVCIKGMPRTLERIKRLEGLVASQFEKAKSDAESGVFGADRWETHLGWKLAHIRTQRMRLESDDTQEGAILWIPPEHDPSPIRRSLDHRSYKTKTDENGLVDASTAAALLGVNDA